MDEDEIKGLAFAKSTTRKNKMHVYVCLGYDVIFGQTDVCMARPIGDFYCRYESRLSKNWSYGWCAHVCVCVCSGCTVGEK